MNKYEKALNELGKFDTILPNQSTIILQELVERTKESKALEWDDENVFECEHCLQNGDTDSAWIYVERGEYNFCPRCGHPLKWNSDIE